MTSRIHSWNPSGILLDRIRTNIELVKEQETNKITRKLLGQKIYEGDNLFAQSRTKLDLLAYFWRAATLPTTCLIKEKNPTMLSAWLDEHVKEVLNLNYRRHKI